MVRAKKTSFAKCFSSGHRKRSRRVPTSHRQQQARLLRLRKLALTHRPQCYKPVKPPTNGMHIKLTPNMKDRISTITAYNPTRDSLLTSLSRAKITKMQHHYDRIALMNRLSLPKVGEDKMLNKALKGINAKCYYDNDDIQKYLGGNSKYLKNELELQNSSTPVSNSNYHFIDIDAERKKFNVDDLARVDLDSYPTTPEDEQRMFTGLKQSDFTTIRRFDYMRPV